MNIHELAALPEVNRRFMLKIRRTMPWPRESWRNGETCAIAAWQNASDPDMLFCAHSAEKREQYAEALRRIAKRSDRMNDARAVLVFWLFVAWLAAAFTLGVLFVFLF